MAVAMLEDTGEAHSSSRENQSNKRKYLRGLFSGGTLAIETVRGLNAFLGEVYTNLSGTGAKELDDPLVSKSHTILDLGEDVFTVGRLHPMIDNDLRIRRMKQEADDPEVSLLLLDVVLGEGAHPNPAGELAPVIQAIHKEKDIAIAVLLIGTDEDPQGLDQQRQAFEASGAVVLTETMDLVEFALSVLPSGEAMPMVPVELSSLNEPVAAINIGLETFFDSLTQQGAKAVQVDWRPPAGGDERLMDILSKMKSSGKTP
jgi:FdrA protein